MPERNDAQQDSDDATRPASHRLPQPEPWLRGAIPDLDPLLAPTVRSFQQVREELAYWTAGIGSEALWQPPLGLAPLGFQLRHIAGSVDRLTTYLEGGQLSAGQLAELAAESDGGSLEDLLAAVEQALERAESVVRRLPHDTLCEPRWVGRQGLPTTVMGLVVHLAEHTQRHLGQAILTAKLAGLSQTPAAPAAPAAKH